MDCNNNVHLKTDNTTKTGHLPLGKLMFRMTRQTRIIDTPHLPVTFLITSVFKYKAVNPNRNLSYYNFSNNNHSLILEMLVLLSLPLII